MSTVRIYDSSNGDTWDLIESDAHSGARVRHTANPSSGGSVHVHALEDFLKIAPHSAEHQALVEHLSAGPSGNRSKLRGYIHDPQESDGPYIAVVLSEDSEPVITLHRSYAEAERELRSKNVDQKKAALSHQVRDV